MTHKPQIDFGVICFTTRDGVQFACPIDLGGLIAVDAFDPPVGRAATHGCASDGDVHHHHHHYVPPQVDFVALARLAEASRPTGASQLLAHVPTLAAVVLTATAAIAAQWAAGRVGDGVTLPSVAKIERNALK